MSKLLTRKRSGGVLVPITMPKIKRAQSLSLFLFLAANTGLLYARTAPARTAPARTAPATTALATTRVAQTTLAQTKRTDAPPIHAALSKEHAASSTASLRAEPIPDAKTLLAQVQAEQRKMSAQLENYTYKEVTATSLLDKHGRVSKTFSETDDVFFVNGHEIDRMVARNGHPLSEKEQKKEQERVNKAVAMAVKTPRNQSSGSHEVSISQLLNLMTLSHPRRVMVASRPTLVFDFVGNPHAHTHGAIEGASKKVTGSLWIDEQDRNVEQMLARFDANFHMGWGIFALDKGSSFDFVQQRVAPGIWLPSRSTMHIVAHAFGFMSYRANIVVTDSDYKVFHVAVSTETVTRQSSLTKK